MRVLMRVGQIGRGWQRRGRDGRRLQCGGGSECGLRAPPRESSWRGLGWCRRAGASAVAAGAASWEGASGRARAAAGLQQSTTSTVEGFCPTPTRSRHRRRRDFGLSALVGLPTPTALSCRCHRQGQWSRRFLCRLAPSPCHTHAGHACLLRHPLDNFKVMRCAAAVERECRMSGLWTPTASQTFMVVHV